MAKKRSQVCPLYLHKGTRQWSKKINGKTVYFGTDKAEALKRYAEEKDRLLAGLPIVRHSDAPTLAELGNVFIADCRNRVASGTLGQRSVDDYQATIGRLIEMRGRDDKPDHWSPLDYATIANDLAKPVERKSAIRGGIKGPKVDRRSPVTVSNDIRRIRAFLQWCFESEFIKQPRYGRSFSTLSAKDARKIRARAGRKDFDAGQVQAILSHCSPQFRPLVMLAINGGIGNLDLATMTMADYRGEWLDLPRNKTGAPRRVWLWPETRQAIDSYMLVRRDRGELLFYTRQGYPWVRGNEDAIGQAFSSARKAAGLTRGTFYDLRRTFATVAGETADIAAIRLVMGHTASANDMTALYCQAISDDRIRTVCQHVRGWLLSSNSDHTTH